MSLIEDARIYGEIKKLHMKISRLKATRTKQAKMIKILEEKNELLIKKLNKADDDLSAMSHGTYN